MPGALFEREDGLPLSLPSYIPLLSRNSKLLAELIGKTRHEYSSKILSFADSQREFAQGEISTAGERNEIKKYRARYLFAPALFFGEGSKCATLFIETLSKTLQKSIDPYDF